MKKKILLNWDYVRKDHLEPFYQMMSDCEFVFIHKKSKPSNEIDIPFQVIYWSDFKSPYDLLEIIKPDKVVFSGLESFYEISLNIACRNKNIVTYFLQHGGPMQNLDFYKEAYKNVPNEFLHEVNNQSLLVKLHATFFYFRAIKFKNLFSFHKIVWYYILRRLSSNYMKVLERVQFELRKPNFYIECTFHNASWIKQRDKITDDRVIPIGVMSLDAYFDNYTINDVEKENIFLLIDSPVELIPSLNITEQEHFIFYEKLNDLALKDNCKLYVKLHPKKYGSTNMPNHPNIVYLKDTTIIKEIRVAKSCFCFYSTLAMPAIYFTNCTMIKMNEESSVQDDWQALGIVNTLNFLDFSKQTFISTDDIIKKQNLEKFVSLYLYKTDGSAVERLKEILAS